MKSEALETIEYKGYTINIYQDDSPENPREWSNLGTMVCFHHRYDLGDKQNFSLSDFNSWEAMEKHLRKKESAIVVLPLYLLDHSGLRMRTYTFNDRWDSGQIGFIYVTKENAKKDLNWKQITKKHIKKLIEYLIGEVTAYDQYLSDDVYGYEVIDKDGEFVDICWGFYGMDIVMSEAKSVVDYKEKKNVENILPESKIRNQGSEEEPTNT